jgi:predicted lipoprotein with Yx(FWY)xxD motif
LLFENWQKCYHIPAEITVCKKGDFMRNTTLFLLLLVVISTLFIAGCTQQLPVQPTPQPTAVKPESTIGTTSSSLGIILVDAQGKTLYYFTNDIPASGTSSCNGQCAVIWPVFSIDTVTVSPPLSASDFSSITRADGKKQTAYRGRPLYYYQADTKLGDMNGQGFNNLWYVANISGITPVVTTQPTTVPTTVRTTTVPTTVRTTSPSSGGYGGGGGY